MTELKEELFDGILLCLKGINDKKSYPAQKRLVRRIVEKRMAQAVHHAMGHERGYVSTRQVVKYSSWCMREFHGHCTCSVDNNL